MVGSLKAAGVEGSAQVSCDVHCYVTVRLALTFLLPPVFNRVPLLLELARTLRLAVDGLVRADGVPHLPGHYHVFHIPDVVNALVHWTSQCQLVQPGVVLTARWWEDNAVSADIILVVAARPWARQNTVLVVGIGIGTGARCRPSTAF